MEEGVHQHNVALPAGAAGWGQEEKHALGGPNGQPRPEAVKLGQSLPADTGVGGREREETGAET